MQLRSTSNVPQCDTATVYMYVLHACMHAPLMYFMHVGLNVLHVFSSFVWISVSLRQKLVANAQNGRFLTFYQKSGNVVKFSAFLRISNNNSFFWGKTSNDHKSCILAKKGHISIPIWRCYIFVNHRPKCTKIFQLLKTYFKIFQLWWCLQGTIFKINIDL